MTDCPECESGDVDVAPASSQWDLECQECGCRFNAGEDEPGYAGPRSVGTSLQQQVARRVR